MPFLTFGASIDFSLVVVKPQENSSTRAGIQGSPKRADKTIDRLQFLSGNIKAHFSISIFIQSLPFHA
jgi:hypothetical protein